MGAFVLGLTAAMEEQYAENPKKFILKDDLIIKNCFNGTIIRYWLIRCSKEQ